MPEERKISVAVNKTQLKERGWTDGLIHRLLPPPVVEERYSSVSGDYITHLWDEAVVHAAESSDDWSTTQLRLSKAATKRAERREVDLLAAIFTVNRAAMRQRDLAQKYYLQGMHGFAGSSKRRKRQYYDLKDRGIIAAHQAGRLSCAFHHGELYLWQGEGYSFHSTLRPKGCDAPDLPLPDGEEHLFIDAKPRRAREPRLRDAVGKLENLAGSLDACASLPAEPDQRFRQGEFEGI